MKHKIILLEDNPAIQDVVKEILLYESYEVYCSSTVSEFWQIPGLEQLDLFILDYCLPDGDGIEVCKILKANHLTQNIPVILFTASDANHLIVQMPPVEDIIFKPFDMEDLINAVHGALQIK